MSKDSDSETDKKQQFPPNGLQQTQTVPALVHQYARSHYQIQYSDPEGRNHTKEFAVSHFYSYPSRFEPSSSPLNGMTSRDQTSVTHPQQQIQSPQHSQGQDQFEMQPNESQPENQQQSSKPSSQPYQHPFQPYSGQQGQIYYVPTNPNTTYTAGYTPPVPPAHQSPMVRGGDRFSNCPRTGGEESEGWRGFNDKNVRATFIRKVYIILMIQLLFTMGIVALFVFEPNVKRFVQEHIFLYFISLRNYPTNIIVLFIFTLAMSYMMGTISSFYNTEAVLMAVGITAVVCLAVSVFSFYTKFDFTSCGGVLCILMIVLILFGLIAIFLPSRIMTIIYASAGVIVFTLFLAYDTQMLMGGKKVELSPEEHIFAAVQLYIDIIYIFQYILLLIGGISNE